MKWYITAIKDNYFNFSGRARRKEYWIFVLINTIFTITAIYLDNILGLNFVNEKEIFNEIIEIEKQYGYIYSLYTLILFIPSLSISFRRLHDTGRSGWYFLWFLLPLLGIFPVLIAMIKDSIPGENRYGISPKYLEDNVEKNVE